MSNLIGILVVDLDDQRRSSLSAALSVQGVRVWDVPRASDAMSVLNKEKVDAIVAAEGDRRLSLRGLCQRARRQNKEILIFIRVLPDGGSDDLEAALGLSYIPLAHDKIPREISKEVRAKFDAPSGPLEELSLDFLDSPTQADTEALHASAALSPEPLSAAALSPEPLSAAALSSEPFSVDALSLEPLSAAALSLEPLSAAALSPEPLSAAALSPEPLSVDALSLEPLAAELKTIELLDAESDALVSLASQENAPVAVDEKVDAADATAVESRSSGSEGVQLDTALSPIAGLLMHLFFQEQTGRIELAEPCPFHRIYLFKGDPAWMDYRGGDAELFSKMQDAGILDPSLARPDVPEEHLLVALIGEKYLSQTDAEDFMKTEVRRAVMEILRDECLMASWEEVADYAQIEPPFRYNAFGMVLECRRESMSADRLLAIANEKEHHFVVPQEGFQIAADRVSPFVRGAKISDWVTGEHTLGVLSERTGLDVMIGTLVLCALEEAGVVRLSETRETVS